MEVVMITQEDTLIEAGQAFVIDTFQPEDAEGVTRLFNAVYGDGYPVKLVYNPQELITAFKAGENVPVVARTSKGDVVGYVALYRSAPNPQLYEGGQGLVLPAYRSAGIGLAVTRHASEVLIPQMGIEVILGEAVCNHVYMQKSVAVLGHIPMALEVDLMPAEAYSKEKSASGRVAALAGFRVYRRKPHTVYVPQIYQEPLDYLYSGFDDPRTFAVSGETIPAGPGTDLAVQVFDFAKVARVTVLAAGQDFDHRLRSEEEKLQEKGIIVMQVWLNLSCPWVGQIAELLRQRGYFLGGVLPRWFDDDGLLMQKIKGRPNWEGIQLYLDRAKKILEFVRGDWEKI
jgi:hypothetical protein